MLRATVTRLPRPFYGWYIVAAGMLITFAAGPGQSFMFTVFIDPIIADTGYTRTAVSTIYAAGTIVSALAVLIVSRLADRYGPRLMLVIIGTLFGLACFGLSVESGLITIAISLAFLRGLGQGALPVNTSIIVSQWFIHHRGRAMSALGLAAAATVAIMPNLGQWLIQELTWRGAYIVLGFLVWAIVLPLAILIIRNQPEDMGLYPDGARTLPEDELRRAQSARSGLKRRILSSFDFWSIAFPLSIPALADTALVFHQVAIFERQGLTAEVAARVFIPFAIVSALTSLVAGVIVEHTGPTPLFAVNMGIFITAIIILQMISTPISAGLYAGVLGCAMGMQQIGMRYTWPYYYGRIGLGQVQGSAMMVMIAATAIGPVAFVAMTGTIGFAMTYAIMGIALAAAAAMRLSYSPEPA